MKERSNAGCWPSACPGLVLVPWVGQGRFVLGSGHQQTSPLLDLSYALWHNRGMADTITFRPDEDASRALDVLTKDGTSISTAVRSALIEAARNRAAASLRAEAEALAADEHDRAVAVQVLRDMETLRAW